MRKTVVTVATAITLMATVFVEAKSTQNPTNALEVSSIFKNELNSFCKAIMKGDVDMVKKLIRLGEDVNKKSLGMTPAIVAARYNKVKILEVLIANGADLKLRSTKGWSIEKYAKLSNAKEVLALLKTQA